MYNYFMQCIILLMMFICSYAAPLYDKKNNLLSDKEKAKCPWVDKNDTSHNQIAPLDNKKNNLLSDKKKASGPCSDKNNTSHNQILYADLKLFNDRLPQMRQQIARTDCSNLKQTAAALQEILIYVKDIIASINQILDEIDQIQEKTNTAQAKSDLEYLKNFNEDYLKDIAKKAQQLGHEIYIHLIEHQHVMDLHLYGGGNTWQSQIQKDKVIIFYDNNNDSNDNNSSYTITPPQGQQFLYENLRTMRFWVIHNQNLQPEQRRYLMQNLNSPNLLKCESFVLPKTNESGKWGAIDEGLPVVQYTITFNDQVYPDRELRDLLFMRDRIIARAYTVAKLSNKYMEEKIRPQINNTKTKKINAATKIQTIYRGHLVQKSLTEKEQHRKAQLPSTPSTTTLTEHNELPNVESLMNNATTPSSVTEQKEVSSEKQLSSNIQIQHNHNKQIIPIIDTNLNTSSQYTIAQQTIAQQKTKASYGFQKYSNEQKLQPHISIQKFSQQNIPIEYIKNISQRPLNAKSVPTHMYFVHSPLIDKTMNKLLSLQNTISNIMSYFYIELSAEYSKSRIQSIDLIYRCNNNKHSIQLNSNNTRPSSFFMYIFAMIYMHRRRKFL